jgi:hypothetical protein
MDSDCARSILQRHWCELATNLEKELDARILERLQNTRVLTNDEVNEVLAKEEKGSQAIAILTAMGRKSEEEVREFAEVLSSCEAPGTSLVGKKILETRGYKEAETDSKDHVQGRGDVFQPMSYQVQSGFQRHCPSKLQIIILVVMLLTVVTLLTVLFTSSKWVQLQQSVVVLKQCNESLTYLSNNCTTLKVASERMLQETEIDEKCSKLSSARRKQLLTIQKNITDTQTYFSSEHIRDAMTSLNERLLKEYHDQAEKEKRDLSSQLQESRKSQAKVLDSQQELYEEILQLRKELTNLRAESSEGSCADRPQQTTILQDDHHDQGTHNWTEKTLWYMYLTSPLYFLLEFSCSFIWRMSLMTVVGAPSQHELHKKLHPMFLFFFSWLMIYFHLYHPFLYCLFGGIILYCVLKTIDIKS